MDDTTRTAVSATLHCLTGCAIGEITGLLIGTAVGLSAGTTVVLAVSLAFLFGYLLSTLPLLEQGLRFGPALRLVLAADTLSIAVMEIVDNGVMLLIPGAMDEGLLNPVFWLGMMLALTVAFFAAVPVNKALIARGRGHALVHHVGHAGNEGHEGHAPARRAWAPRTGTLVAGVVGFLLGGLVTSVGAELEGDADPGHAAGGASVVVPGARI